ncbi:hypothetical protein F5Y08DRAFT_320741 [Xylaria arbuscula]|uniref:Uncharacterized protein n=1 Tax=Xylaria arbuscula TaxID=114810 RepID=A0A9W8NEW6_9PEZI|nr:hypothetical protein F5Y08DRAFT_320741 [Xylaria arbuscula]KAJ3571933.1 hypothetical protein NPX13_g5209 [Xylaria arbuscula]
MSFTKTYFLCPTSDFIHPPPVGPLCLGSIIRSTSVPQYPLNRGNTVTIANELPPVVETNWKKITSTKKGVGSGVFAHFLQLATGGLPLGPELNVENSNVTVNAFAFDTLTTLAFEPTQDYVKEAITAPAVRMWLREPKQRFTPTVSLYLVTGIKLVKGARIRHSRSHSTTVTGNFGIDAAALGTSFGPKGHWVRMKEDEFEFNRDSEFVFAFSVKRLKFGRRLKIEEYNRGAFLAFGEEQEEEAHDDVSVEEVDGSEIETAKVIYDVNEDRGVYCVPT